MNNVKIIVLERGWHEYKVDGKPSFENLLGKVKELYKLMPQANIYLDWKENSMFVDPITLDHQLNGREHLH